MSKVKLPQVVGKGGEANDEPAQTNIVVTKGNEHPEENITWVKSDERLLTAKELVEVIWQAHRTLAAGGQVRAAAQSQLAKDKEWEAKHDPQAALVGWFLEHGWIPPEEARIKDANNLARRLLIEQTQKELPKCKVCMRVDKFNFHVPDAVWQSVVPQEFQTKVVCLDCFDNLAKHKNINYAKSIHSLYFAGEQASFEFSVVRRATN